MWHRLMVTTHLCTCSTLWAIYILYTIKPPYRAVMYMCDLYINSGHKVDYPDHTTALLSYMVHYHGNHFLNPIFLGSESGCHGNVLKHPLLSLALPQYNGTVRGAYGTRSSVVYAYAGQITYSYGLYIASVYKHLHYMGGVFPLWSVQQKQTIK